MEILKTKMFQSNQKLYETSLSKKENKIKEKDSPLKNLTNHNNNI